jgi:hypothetical protein
MRMDLLKIYHAIGNIRPDFPFLAFSTIVPILLFIPAYINQLMLNSNMIHHIIQADDRGTAAWPPPLCGS